MKPSLLLAMALMGSVALPATAFASDPAARCEALKDLSIPNVRIDIAHLKAAGELPPDPNSAMTGGSPRALQVGTHCLVEGIIEAREGIGGQYGTRFQFRAPVDWNGRFLFQGGGGMDGFIAPAVGFVPVVQSTAEPALTRGYAVVSMNGGHDGMGPNDSTFAQDQQARFDEAYQSIGKVTSVAKNLVTRFYGKTPDHSFFMGCSNGGRQAMLAAQRFPLEFDGVVAGNPAFHISRAPLGEIWDLKQLMPLAPRENGAPILSKALTQADMDTVSSAILDACDDLDGIKDGIINAYGSCKFDYESLKGKIDDKKVDALKAMMSGAKADNGNAVYTGFPADAGLNSMGWRMWKLGTSDTAVPNALAVSIGLNSYSRLFMTPPVETADIDYMTMDFGKAASDMSIMGGLFDATYSVMNTYARRGGKMIIFQGLSDPIFSATDIMEWYNKANKDTVADFSRLFMVPGMTHCGGGSALNDFDPLTILENWTINGVAPRSMPASGKGFPGKSQPICAFPQEAHYTGGDPDKLESYSCR
ncbi:tannase/feruloyl esterase family alpha/beta hydrolase [uncultured Cohaesibacter sp.]|uniref:tannase/feruloyl esterase family alpha/beta hydrolase n=1 Tax=uncultured Cohaesibacter sp. TaxID=1002546 RepID=UPI0029C61918|nr:tannase/feruloyl esterase family alpha/beta hydrolase [uncultured Cohaesibacter sp.]